jgi:hypothetical protein
MTALAFSPVCGLLQTLLVRQSSENVSPAYPKIPPTVAATESYVMLAFFGEATLAG